MKLNTAVSTSSQATDSCNRGHLSPLLRPRRTIRAKSPLAAPRAPIDLGPGRSRGQRATENPRDELACFGGSALHFRVAQNAPVWKHEDDIRLHHACLRMMAANVFLKPNRAPICWNEPF